MKQETLEEVAARLVKETTLYGSQKVAIGSSARSYYETELRCVLMGMKWQKERSYSEGEMVKIINDIVEKHCTYFEQKLKNDIKLEWFEQFKKK